MTHSPLKKTQAIPLPTLGLLGAGIAEACLISALLMAALFIVPDNIQICQPPKMYLLRALGLLLLCGTIMSLFSGGNKPTVTNQAILRWSLFGMGLYFAANIISNIISINPHQSFWGSFNFRDGTLSIAVMLAFAACTAFKARSKQTRELIITSIIASSIPLALFGIIEWFGLSPCPHVEKFSRISSLMGNPNYLAGYVIMAIPITAWRAFEHFRRGGPASSAKLLSKTTYAVALSLQITTLIFTGCRGSAIGLLAGMFCGAIVYCAKYKYRIPLLFILATTAIALAASALAYKSDKLQSLEQTPILGRFAALLTHSDESTNDRLRYWDAAVDISSTPEPFLYPSGQIDRLHEIRNIFGHGAELVECVLPQSLPCTAINALCTNRFHNAFWDIWFSTGALGLMAFSTIIIVILYALFSKLCFITNREQGYLFIAVNLACTLFGGSLAMLIRPSLVWLGCVFGLLGGLVLYSSLHAFKHSATKPEEKESLQQGGLALALFVAVIAHLVDISFGFGVISTNLSFWTIIGLAISLSAKSSQMPSPGVEPPLRATGPTRTPLLPVAILTAIVSFLAVLPILSFHSLQYYSAGNIFEKMLLAPGNAAKNSSLLPIVLLAIYSLTVALFAVEMLATKKLLSTLSASCKLILVAVVVGLGTATVKAICFEAIGPIPEQSAGAESIVSACKGYERISVGSLAICLVATVLLGWSLAWGRMNSAAPTNPVGRKLNRRNLIAGCALAAFSGIGIWFLSVRPLMAESAGGFVSTLETTGRYEACVTALKRAIKFDPAPLYYRSMLAMYTVKLAGSPTNPHYEELIESATSELERMQSADMLNPGGSTLGHLLLQRAALETDEDKRIVYANKALRAFDQQLIFQPTTEEALFEKSLVYTCILNQPRQADGFRRKADPIIPIDMIDSCVQFYAQLAELTPAPVLTPHYARRALWYAERAVKRNRATDSSTFKMNMLSAELYRLLGEEPMMRAELENACKEAERPEKDRDESWKSNGWMAEAALAQQYQKIGDFSNARFHANRAVAFAPTEMLANAKAFVSSIIR